ncbi:hypothetical protein HY967_05015 [Candidatus Jorgensenbacteria bacterium]|nr:hypothetical protein [Candidatus Jorgensenbacteria bacterium]
MPEKKFRLPAFVGTVLAVTGFIEKASSVNSEVVEVDQVSRSDNQPDVPGKPPELPTTKRSNPIISKVSTVTKSSVQDETLKNYVDQLLDELLKATPNEFQEFMRQQEASMEELKDVLSGDELVTKATKMALRVTKLKSTDVQNAFASARTALKDKRTDFGSALEKERQDQIEKPTQEIRKTQTEIARLDGEIKRLESQKASLDMSITPARQAIEAAEQNIKEGQEIFERAYESAENVLTEMEKQLLNHSEQPKGRTK